jgi:hypothetical protein
VVAQSGIADLPKIKGYGSRWPTEHEHSREIGCIREKALVLPNKGAYAQGSDSEGAALPDEPLITTEAETPTEASAVLDAPDDEALRLEEALIQPSDNGWSEGDPEDQPDNPEPREQP